MSNTECILCGVSALTKLQWKEFEERKVNEAVIGNRIESDVRGIVAARPLIGGAGGSSKSTDSVHSIYISKSLFDPVSSLLLVDNSSRLVARLH